MKLSEILKEANAPQDQVDAALEVEAKLEKANDEAAHHRKSKGALKKELDQFDGINIEEFKKSQKKLNDFEQDRLKAEGKFDEALKEATKLLDAEVDSLKGLLKDSSGALSTALIDNAVITSIDGKAINNGQVLSLIRGDIKLENNETVVMDGDKHRLNSKGDRMTVAEFASSFLESNPHLAKAKGPGFGSEGKTTTTQNNTDKTVTRAEFNEMDATAQMAHSISGGKVVDI